MKVIHERKKCIGCGLCASVCPKFWEMGDDGKSNLLNGQKNGENYELEVSEAGCNQEAADGCPVQCIKVA
jgi:ferredoxin